MIIQITAIVIYYLAMFLSCPIGANAVGFRKVERGGVQDFQRVSKLSFGSEDVPYTFQFDYWGTYCFCHRRLQRSLFDILNMNHV